MSRKQKIIVSVVGITIVLLALLGITYAYYLTRIQGNTNINSISITTADLKLVYRDGNGHVSKENIMPGTTFEKTFTVTNEGNSTIDNYAVYLEEVVNTLSRTEDLTYVLECTSSSGTCSGATGEFPTLAEMIVANSIDVGVTHSYTLTVIYENLDTVNQSEDMGSTISAFVQIYAMKDIVDITGTVTGASDGDYIQINSVQKRSQISKGTYTLGGVKPGSHTIKVCDSSDTTCSNPKLTKNITINLGTTANVSGDMVTITDESQTITINIDLTESSITLNDEVNNMTWSTAPSGTLLYAIKNHNEITSGVPNPSDILEGKISSIEYYTESNSILPIDSTQYIVYASDIDFDSSTYTGINQCSISSEDCQSVIIGKYGIKATSSELSADELEELKQINLNWYIVKITEFDPDVQTSEPLTTDVYSPISVLVEDQLKSMEDDYGNSYYFRGVGKTNHVNFLNMCWRILRVQGDGTIKLVLDDKENLCDSTSYTNKNGIIGKADYGYVMNNSTLVADYLNTENRTTSMKYMLEDWYDKNIKDNTNLTKTNPWCYQDFDSSAFNLKCDQTKQVNSYIGTFTADELGLALGSILSYTSYHFYEPEGFIYYDAYFRNLSQNASYTMPCDQIVGDAAASALANVIPVITIKSDTVLSSNTSSTQIGTKENPYVIE